MANKELVDSEVRQAMTRMAEVFAEDVAAEERLASALLLWPVQQLQYEQRCQVHTLLLHPNNDNNIYYAMIIMIVNSNDK